MSLTNQRLSGQCADWETVNNFGMTHYPREDNPVKCANLLANGYARNNYCSLITPVISLLGKEKYKFKKS